MWRWLTLAVTVLVVTAASLSMAQAPTERAASGNAPSLSTSARIDMTNESIRRFIATQQTLLSGTQTTVNTTNTTILNRLGAIRNTLIGVNMQSGCDPELGPHGCPNCACAGPNQKILWTGLRWQCFESTCPVGQVYNPATCSCEGACVPPPNGCPVGYTWNAALCRCECDGGGCICPPPRVKDQYGVCNCPGGSHTCRAGGSVICMDCPPGHDFNPDTCSCSPNCEQAPMAPGCIDCTDPANQVLPQCGGPEECQLTAANCPAGTTFHEEACVCSCDSGNCGHGTSPVVCPPPLVTGPGGICRLPNNCPPGTTPGPNGDCVPACP